MKMEIIKIPEQFSLGEAEHFREMVYNRLTREAVSFELDFSGCTFIDSTGLGVLVGLYKKCAEQGTHLILKHVRSDIRKIFSMTRLDQIFTII